MNLRKLALIAVFGPIIFVAVVAILTALELDFLRGLGWEPIGASDVPWPSTTALGPYGWAQIVNFLLLGSALLSLTVGLWRVLRPVPRVGLVSLAVIGAAMLLSAFPTDGSSTGFTTTHGAIHFVAFFTFVLAAVVGQIALGLSLRRRLGWEAVGRYSLAAVVLTFVFLIASFAVQPAANVLASMALLTSLAWVELLALRLLSESVAPGDGRAA
jgi:hypothetical protein